MLTNRAGFHVSIFCGFALVILFQNCGKKSGAFFDEPSQGGAVSFDVQVLSSSAKEKLCFEVGHVANFSLKSFPSKRTITYTLIKLGAGVQTNPGEPPGNIIASANVTTPANVQRVFKDDSDLGEYNLLVVAKDGNRTVSSKTYSFSVKRFESCSSTCNLSISSGLSYSIGQQIQYSITSQTPGLPAFLEKAGVNQPIGATPVNSSEVASLVGSFRWAAYTRGSDGAMVKCGLDQTIQVSAAPTPAPTPVPTQPPPGVCAAWSNGYCSVGALTAGQSFSVACNAGYNGTCSGSCGTGGVQNYTHTCTPIPTPTPVPTSTWNFYQAGGTGGSYEDCLSLTGQACSPIGSRRDCYYDIGLSFGGFLAQMICGPVPTGSISVAPSGGYCVLPFNYSTNVNDPCTATISWSTNAGFSQVFYRQNNAGALIYLGCSTNSSSQMTLTRNDISSSVSRTFYLFLTDSCTPLNNPLPSGAFKVSSEMVWYLEPYSNPRDDCGRGGGGYACP